MIRCIRWSNVVGSKRLTDWTITFTETSAFLPTSRRTMKVQYMWIAQNWSSLSRNVRAYSRVDSVDGSLARTWWLKDLNVTGVSFYIRKLGSSTDRLNSSKQQLEGGWILDILKTRSRYQLHVVPEMYYRDTQLACLPSSPLLFQTSDISDSDNIFSNTMNDDINVHGWWAWQDVETHQRVDKISSLAMSTSRSLALQPITFQ